MFFERVDFYFFLSAAREFAMERLVYMFASSISYPVGGPLKVDTNFSAFIKYRSFIISPVHIKILRGWAQFPGSTRLSFKVRHSE